EQSQGGQSLSHIPCRRVARLGQSQVATACKPGEKAPEHRVEHTSADPERWLEVRLLMFIQYGPGGIRLQPGIEIPAAEYQGNQQQDDEGQGPRCRSQLAQQKKSPAT